MCEFANGGPSQALAASFESVEVSEQWLRRLGTYHPADVNGGLLGEVTLERHEDLEILMGKFRTTDDQQLDFALELLSGSEAAIAGVGRYTGEVIEFVTDDEFVFEGARFKWI